MREKRYRGDVRYRSPPQSPLRSRARNREYSPPSPCRFDRSLDSVANKSDRKRRIMDRASGSSARRDYDRHYDDGDKGRGREVQSRRLSEFSEGLSRVEESTAMKFQWKHLLAEPTAKLSAESGNDNHSLNRSIDDYVVNRGSIERNYEDIRYLDTKQKSYEDIRDTKQKSYEDIRYSDTDQKKYQDIRYSETNRTGMLFEKPISVEAGRVKSCSFYSPDVGVSKSSGHLDDVFTMPSLNLNLGLCKDEPAFDSRFQLHLDKPTRELYKEERNSMVYSKDALDYKFSGSKAIGTESLGLLKEDFPGSFKGYGLSPEINTRPLGNDGYRQELRSKSPVELYDRRDYHCAYRNPTDEKHGDYAYLDGQRSVRGHTGVKSTDEKHGDNTYLDGQRSVRGHLVTTSTDEKHGDYTYLDNQRSVRGRTIFEEFRGNMLTIAEKYGHQDSLRTSIVDPIVDRIEESSHREQLRELRVWDHVPSSQGQESPNYLEESGSLHIRKQDREVLGFGSTHFEYERDEYEDRASLLSGESHGYERGGDLWTREDSCEMLPIAEYDPYLDGMDDSSSGTILKRKRDVDEKSGMLKFGSKTPSSGKSTRRTHDHGVADGWRTGEDRKPCIFSKKSRFSHSKYGKTGIASNETTGHGNPNPDHWSSSSNGLVSITRRLSKPHSSRVRDIKNRLGPGPQDSHVSHRLGKNDKSLLKNRLGPRPQNIRVSHSSLKNEKAFLKKRLGPGPQKFRVSLPWLNPYQHQRFPRKIQVDGLDRGLHDEGGEGDPLEGNLMLEKAEPPESSEDFKQLVHHTFFRFVKQLNEKSGQRRRFLEQGKAGTLKCSICGSDSEEFIDTESLALHAFTSSKVGCKSQHLGFHKALCVLMGWKSEAGPGSPWVCEILSEAEASALKEDLIIWPPVVIIHNSSIGNKNPEDRVIVSIEVLESILKEMGFGEKTKVSRGKPANHSIMVVKFNATFSGLQEAKRLHTFYAKTNRGRPKFHHFDSTGETLPEASSKVEQVLYGHLGLAEDLDKLDFETKKRCLVKSKREIQNIADAPLKTE